jgi:hypothetical protein
MSGCGINIVIFEGFGILFLMVFILSIVGKFGSYPEIF